MSIAFERSSGNSIHRSSGFASIHDMSSFLGVFQGDRRRFPAAADDDDDSSSSSLGRNSDLSSDGEDSGEDFEVSEVLRGPLDTMCALEEVLPIKRGMSKFFSGKSKSFTSLADASIASSVQDLAKPENPYTRKRKNLLARGNVWDDKNRASPSKNNASKKPSISNQSALNHGCLINYTKSSSDIREESQSRSSSPSSSRPPLHSRPKPSHGYGSCSSPPRRKSPWRSLSLSDLQSAAGNCND